MSDKAKTEAWFFSKIPGSGLIDIFIKGKGDVGPLSPKGLGYTLIALGLTLIFKHIILC